MRVDSAVAFSAYAMVASISAVVSAPSVGSAESSGIRSCNVGLQWVREERLSDLKEDRLLASYTSRRLYSSQTQTALTSRFTRLRVRVAHDDAEQGEAAAER